MCLEGICLPNANWEVVSQQKLFPPTTAEWTGPIKTKGKKISAFTHMQVSLLWSPSLSVSQRALHLDDRLITLV